MGRLVWINGQFVPEKEAVYSVYSSPLMFGDTAFEMMRTFNKRTFRLTEHLERLMRSIQVLEIDIHFTVEDLYLGHESLLKKHIEMYPFEEEWRTLINISRGILPIYQPLLGDKGEPDVMMTCFPLRYVLKDKAWYYSIGVDAHIVSQRAIPSYLLDARIKSRSRQHYKMADLQVKRIDPNAWALLLDTDGFIAEGTGSNFFIVKDGQYYTPEGRNCLRGITRATVMNMLPTIEKNLTEYDAITADEAFFTCTPFAVVPCTSVNGHKLGEGLVGEKTRQAMKVFKSLTGCDYIKQAEKWDEKGDE